MPGGTFHAQEAEDMAAREAYRMDAALQADGTLRGSAGGGSIPHFLNELGRSQGVC